MGIVFLLRYIKQNIIDSENYLEKRAAELPRTALRYAIEKLPENKRRRFMRRPL